MKKFFTTKHERKFFPLHPTPSFKSVSHEKISQPADENALWLTPQGRTQCAPTRVLLNYFQVSSTLFKAVLRAST